MLARRRKEVDLLSARYGELEHGPQLEWVIFTAFHLPPGWSKTLIRLLVLIPPGYPVTPPDNFYVEPGLKLASGAAIQNFTEPVSHIGQPWGQFSFHIDNGWSPTSDILGGHNLLTFLLAVEKRLGEAN